jgi:hypothetical protein
MVWPCAIIGTSMKWALAEPMGPLPQSKVMVYWFVWGREVESVKLDKLIESGNCSAYVVPAVVLDELTMQGVPSAAAAAINLVTSWSDARSHVSLVLVESAMWMIWMVTPTFDVREGDVARCCSTSLSDILRMASWILPMMCACRIILSVFGRMYCMESKD